MLKSHSQPVNLLTPNPVFFLLHLTWINSLASQLADASIGNSLSEFLNATCLGFLTLALPVVGTPAAESMSALPDVTDLPGPPPVVHSQTSGFIICLPDLTSLQSL